MRSVSHRKDKNVGEVICSVYYQNNQKEHKRDLILPDQIPVHQLANVIALSLGLPKNRDTYYELKIFNGQDLARLPEAKNLQQSYILNGSKLYLHQESEDPQNRAFLESESGLKMRLRENTLLGRLTSNSYVDIDLTPFDQKKVVSRNHAAITHISYHYVIKDLNSQNGTFINDEPLKQGESVVLHPGDFICLGGSEKGVCLTFTDK